MKIFLDTNVLVAAAVSEHPSHERALAVLTTVQDKKCEGYVSAHSLAEMYAILTKLPPPMRHSPEQALLSIEENVLNYFKILSLTGADYAMMLREAATSGIQGGTIYDAVLLKAASKTNLDRVFTLNIRHFQLIASKNFGPEILAP